MNRGEADRAEAPEIREPARREFARRFDALYCAAGRPSLRVLAAAADKRARAVKSTGRRPVAVSAQRLSDWKGGRNVPARFEMLLPVLLVLIDATRLRGRVARAELVDVRVWKRLWGQARAARPRRAAPSVTHCPFPGPAPYSQSDTRVFTGRATDIAGLAGALEQAWPATGMRRIIVLHGASGVGKTSLIQAGLIPLLKSGTDRQWTVEYFGISDESACFGDGHDGLPWGADTPRRSDAPGGVRGSGVSRRLVIIDQLERLSSDGRRNLHDRLARLVIDSVVLLSVRSDGVGGSGLGGLLKAGDAGSTYLLEPISGDNLRTVTTSCARARGLTLQPGLEELLATVIEGPRSGHFPHDYGASALPVMSQTLRALWSERSGTQLTLLGYRRLGGVEGVVHTMVDAWWESLSGGEREVARELLLELVSVGLDTDVTRRRVRHEVLRKRASDYPSGPRILNAMIDARVITVDGTESYIGHHLMLTWRTLSDWTGDRMRVEHLAAAVSARSSR